MVNLINTIYELVINNKHFLLKLLPKILITDNSLQLPKCSCDEPLALKIKNVHATFKSCTLKVARNIAKLQLQTPKLRAFYYFFTFHDDA